MELNKHWIYWTAAKMLNSVITAKLLRKNLYCTSAIYILYNKIDLTNACVTKLYTFWINVRVNLNMSNVLYGCLKLRIWDIQLTCEKKTRPCCMPLYTLYLTVSCTYTLNTQAFLQRQNLFNYNLTFYRRNWKSVFSISGNCPSSGIFRTESDWILIVLPPTV